MAVEIIPKIDLTQLQQEFLPSKMDNKLIIVANPVYEGAARFPEYLFIIFNIHLLVKLLFICLVLLFTFNKYTTVC